MKQNHSYRQLRSKKLLNGKLLPAGTGLRGPLKSPETLAKEAEEVIAKTTQDESDVDINNEFEESSIAE